MQFDSQKAATVYLDARGTFKGALQLLSYRRVNPDQSECTYGYNLTLP